MDPGFRRDAAWNDLGSNSRWSGVSRGGDRRKAIELLLQQRGEVVGLRVDIIERRDPEALSREYPYYGPISTLPDGGMRWWAEQDSADAEQAG